MHMTVIVDNRSIGDVEGEWGLCIYIEYKGRNILLDSGGSELFFYNCKKLGKKIEDVDIAVLSHAHYDHGNGFPLFLEKNKTAQLYVQESCRDNCYALEDGEMEYIGLPEGMLSKYKDRIERVDSITEIADGVYIVPHIIDREQRLKVGEREQMFIKNGEKYDIDDFSHEQSLVFEGADELVVFNSCCHIGADRVISEIKETFEGKKIKALIGGFHLYNKTSDEVRNFAKRVEDTKIEYICTGHCTGEKAYTILKDVLGEKLHHLKVGLEVDF